MPLFKRQQITENEKLYMRIEFRHSWKQQKLLSRRLDKHAQSQDGLKFLSFTMFMVYTQKWNKQKSLSYFYWDTDDMEYQCRKRKKKWNYKHRARIVFRDKTTTYVLSPSTWDTNSTRGSLKQEKLHI